MARLIPTVIDARTASEREFLEQLMRQLPEDVDVYHNLQFLGEDGRRAGEGEADVVLLSRELGLVVIEVKGGTVSYENNRWKLTDGHGTREIDPVDQCYKALSFFRQKMMEKFGKPVLRTSYAIALPYTNVSGADFQGHEQVLIGGNHLPQLEQRLREIVDSQAPHTRSLIEQVQEMRALLNPIFRAVSSIQSSILSGERLLHRLTEEQTRMWMQVIAPNRRTLVAGPAGTGKTVLARALAVQRAREGKRTLFVCYNRALKDQLTESMRQEDAPVRTHLDVQSIHGIATKLCRDARCPTIDAEQSDLSEHFGHVAGREARLMPRYDCIVVDEGQDVPPDAWLMLLGFFADEELLTIFYDPLQEIFDARQGNARFIEEQLGLKDAGGNPLVPLRLSVNVRNDSPIVDVLQRSYNAGYTNATGNVVQGAGVQHVEGKRDPFERLERVVRELLSDGVEPRQIVVLSFKIKDSFLLPHSTVAGVGLVNEARSTDASKIRCTSIGKFKGLESDVVVLVDGGLLSSEHRKSLEYVGVSRGKHRVVIVD